MEGSGQRVTGGPGIGVVQLWPPPAGGALCRCPRRTSGDIGHAGAEQAGVSATHGPAATAAWESSFSQEASVRPNGPSGRRM